MEAGDLDLLVIGGGITGCGIALDAQQRGLKVGLIEMQDFASGTSSRSTKLIHGGLRYLKQLEINLVREVGQERAILYENAPHVVIPEPMMLPLVKGGTFGKLATSVGLYVYDWLAGVKREERRTMLTKEETLAREPLLKEGGLKGSGLYVEYRTDDARLTLEVIKTAVSLGASAVNYSQALDFIYEDGKVKGVKVKDLVTDKAYDILAKKIVNATGPWVDGLRKKDNSLKGKRLHLTKGVHIVMDQSRFPLKQAVYFDVPDGRMIFAIPRDGKTYVGTTDTSYEGGLVEPQIEMKDKTYLIEATNNMFPSLKLTVDDIESYWVGLRPLIHEDGKSPSQLSRKDEIFLSDSGLITIAGGKLTGFRKMAEKTVNLVVSQLEKEENRSFPACASHKIVLSGGNVGGAKNWNSFFEKKVNEAIALDIPEDIARGLVQRYGSNIDRVFEKIEFVKYQDSNAEGDIYLQGELLYCLEEEMVVTVDDFLMRRTSKGYFDVKAYAENMEIIKGLLNENDANLPSLCMGASGLPADYIHMN